MKRQMLPYYCAAAVSFATLVVYLPALRLQFVWDDFQYVVNNRHVHTLDWALLRWAATDISISYWHPLTWVSHALDHALYGLRPWGHHLTSVLLHAANAFLVVLVVIRLLEAANEVALRFGRSPALGERARLMAGSVTGALFGLHPLHVESAAWVAERKDLLCAFFFLMSIMAYIVSVRGRTVREDGAGPASAWLTDRAYLLSFGSFVLALMSKPMAVTLPVVLLLLDWQPFARLASRKDRAVAVAEKVPFAGLSIVVSAVTFWAQKGTGAVISLDAIPLTARFLVAAKALSWYLWKMIAPIGLSPLYPVPDEPSALSPEYLFAIAFLVVGTAACIAAARKHGVLAAAWGYYLITLLPVLGIVRVGTVAMADRFTYLPSLGPFLIAGLAAGRAWDRTGSKVRRGSAARVVLSVAVVVAILLAAGTLHQMTIWQNDVVFWDRVVEQDPDSVLAFNNRAMAYKDRGETDRELADLETAMRLNPRYAGAYVNRALYFLDRGEVERALDDLNTAIAANPNLAAPYHNRGLAMRSIGRPDLAIADLTRAIELDRSDAGAFMLRGLTLEDRGQFAEAISDLSESIRLQPDTAETYIYRGVAYKELGLYERALADYATAIALRPTKAEPYNNEGVVYKHLGELDRAIASYTRAIELDPAFSLAYCNRGMVLGMMGHADQAIEDYSRAISLQPGLIRAYLERGDLYRERGERSLARADYRKACEAGSEDGCRAARLPGR